MVVNPRMQQGVLLGDLGSSACIENQRNCAQLPELTNQNPRPIGLNIQCEWQVREVGIYLHFGHLSLGVACEVLLCWVWTHLSLEDLFASARGGRLRAGLRP